MNSIPLPSPGWRDRLLAGYRRSGRRGFLTLQRLLKPSGARPEIRETTRYGSQFYLRPGDEVDRHVLLSGFYESEVVDAVLPALGPGTVLWVVGANFGLHAVTVKRLRPEATVVAFEPAPELGARILENARLNGVAVDLHAYALAGVNGTASFYVNSTGNPGMSTLHPQPNAAYDPPVHVATRTPAEVIARREAPAPTVVIVDAEGAEADIIGGFGAQLSSPSLRLVVFEALTDLGASAESAKLRDLLAAAGFRCRALPRQEPTGHALSNFAATRSP